MLKEQAKLFNRLNLLLDITAIIVSFFVAYATIHYTRANLGPLLDYVWVLLFAVPFLCLLMQGKGFYASIRRLTIFDIITRLINVHLYGGVAVAAVVYFIDRDHYSRVLLLTFLGTSLLLLTLEKVGLRLGLGYLRRHGMNYREILVVGTYEKAARFHELVEQHADWGLRILGFVQALDGPLKDKVGGYRVLGRIDDLPEICKSFPVDEVVFALPKDYIHNTEESLRKLEELGITGRVVLDYYDVPQFRKEISFFHDDLPILSFHTKSFDAQQLFLKRMLDIFGALVGLSITALLFPFIALAIKKNSPGPLFFGQKRVGLGGRIFKCWKFRSMYIDAEERKQELMAQNEMDGAMFKMKNDPRITRVGHFLRKTSLDELPQFWNVLKGEMSLVGTRPPTPGEVTEYENWHRRRISIKPGITGNWQVSGRSEIKDFDEIVRLDLYYIDHWSVWLDVKIILKTIKVVALGSGSC